MQISTYSETVITTALLIKIKVEGIGHFIYNCENSVDFNMTAMLIALNKNPLSVKEALKRCKEHTLVLERNGSLFDLR